MNLPTLLSVRLHGHCVHMSLARSPYFKHHNSWGNSHDEN